jgi:radical SAM family RiPP maturation amino acid epimerase
MKTKKTKLSTLYGDYLNRLTHAQKNTLAEYKRAVELYCGNQVFRQQIRLEQGNFPAVLRQYGLAVDFRSVIPWLKLRFGESDLIEGLADGLDQHPDYVLWLDYRAFLFSWRQACRDENQCRESHPEFHAWRMRQMTLCDDILQSSATAITHPSFAFELSKGCSVNCWFCGLSADSFTGYFAYTVENLRLWQDILDYLKQTFGIHSLQSGFCYWATDPTDNPDYTHFIQDFIGVTNIVPQSTLAKPMRSVQWTRRLLNLGAELPTIHRFSILTAKELAAVHAEFTPLELLNVELVMQHKQAQKVVSKAKAGYARKLPEKAQKLLSEEHTTIACVSGFLINLVTKQIQLIAPRVASAEYPDGFKIFDSVTFEGIEDFKQKIDKITQKRMSQSLSAQTQIKFRADLVYQLTASGFSLASSNNPTRIYHVHHGKPAQALAELIVNKDVSLKDLIKMTVNQGIPVLKTVWILDGLFKKGLLAEQ